MENQQAEESIACSERESIEKKFLSPSTIWHEHIKNVILTSFQGKTS